MTKANALKALPRITLRIAFLAWSVALVTIGLFIFATVPAQRRDLRDALESKAAGVVWSVSDAARSAAISENFSALIDRCRQVLAGDGAIDYLVVTRNDGFSIVVRPGEWKSEKLGESWRPRDRKRVASLEPVSPFKGRVFRLSVPFNTSTVPWGWIHVGLSTKSYDQTVMRVYRRTGILAFVCIVLSLIVSIALARWLVQRIVCDLDAPREVPGHEENHEENQEEKHEKIANLARPLNSITESISRQNRILQSVRLAAEEFLGADDWRDTVTRVLENACLSSDLTRAFLIAGYSAVAPNASAELHFEWVRKEENREGGKASRFESDGCAMSAYWPLLMAGHTITSTAANRPKSLAGRGSLLLAPVRVAGQWFGMVGFEDRNPGREWSDAERDAVLALAAMLGVSMARRQAQQALDTRVLALEAANQALTIENGQRIRTEDSLQRMAAELRSERAELESQVQQRTVDLLLARQAVEAAKCAKGEFFANLSHEIRTPINGVIGMTALALGTSLGMEQRNYLQTAMRAAESLLGVINDLLDFSKIEAGKLELTSTTFNLRDCLEGVVEALASRAHEKELELVLDVQSKAPELVEGDPVRLGQIITNLVHNAIKFTDKGEVALSAGVASVGAYGCTLDFAIRDTGCGITPERQLAVFQPFTQADGSLTRRFGGTGLGLTISSQLANLMGGRIWLHSEVDIGSSFHASLPFRNATDVSGAAVMDMRNARVLIVDDNRTNRIALTKLLQSWGCAATSTDSAKNALSLIRQNTPGENDRATQSFDVILLDNEMPEQNGFVLVEALRGERKLVQSTIVLSTSADPDENLERCRALGIVCCLNKPVRRRELQHGIFKVITEKTTQNDLQALATGLAKAEEAAPLKILLVEDNVVNQRVAASILARLRHQVIIAENGKVALLMLAETQVDLVLMDIQMPEMDGFEATAHIRRQELGSGRRLPIVALTAHAMKGDRERCLESGMDEYLTKPIRAAEFTRVIQGVLASHASRPLAPEPCSSPV